MPQTTKRQAKSSPTVPRETTLPTVQIDLAPPQLTSFWPWYFVLLLFSFGLLYASGTYLFASGFLLNRLELDSVNNCSFPLDIAGDAPKGLSRDCWHATRFKKTLIIVIDALRFDFIDYQENVTVNVPAYINKMPVIHDIIEGKRPGHGLLFQARADPPTTTSQRIKAITTGNLPTVVDAGSNFASSKVNEDNLITQAVKADKRVVMTGDDTWVNLFPETFNQSFVFPSFDVWDLHTVDNGVLKHIYPMLERDSEAKDTEEQGETFGSWDLGIAHFLGVDHAGHRYGPEHPAMAEKLLQMNHVLSSVFEKVDKDTLVVLLGDHGMDTKGDHGGDSEEELSSGLFFYSKSPLTLADKDVSWKENILKRLKELDFKTEEPLVSVKNKRTFPQIDITSTLSLLLGLPIPFGNLGTLIPELFYMDSEQGSALENLLKVTRLNAHQINTYITEYSRHRSWASSALSDLSFHFKFAEEAYKVSRHSRMEKDKVEAYLQYTLYTRRALVSAKKIWARFDVTLMTLGVVLLVVVLLTLLVYSVTLSGTLNATFKYSWISMVVGLLGMSLGLAGVLNHLSFIGEGEDSAQGLHHHSLFLCLLGSLASFILLSLPSLYKVSRTFSWKKVNINVLLGLVLILMYVGSSASDSFTIFEDYVTLYLLQTFGLFNLLSALAVKEETHRDSLIQCSCVFFLPRFY